ncbi:MAG: hypothetical protein ACRDJU_03275, partial [Actinomycetota bacterium]
MAVLPAPGSGAVLPAPVPSARPSDIPVRPDGSWSGSVTLDGVTGPQTLAASCSSTPSGTVDASYADLTITVTTAGRGYWFGWDNGEVTPGGDADEVGERIALNRPLVGMAALPGTGAGYWTAADDGGVFAFGGAGFFGSAEPFKLSAPVVAIAATPDGGGYWLAGSDGGVFAFGDARFFGSAVHHLPVSPVVGIAATPDGGGYWLAESNGNVVAEGDAQAFPAPGRLNAPIVGIAATK